MNFSNIKVLWCNILALEYPCTINQYLLYIVNNILQYQTDQTHLDVCNAFGVLPSIISLVIKVIFKTVKLISVNAMIAVSSN